MNIQQYWAILFGRKLTIIISIVTILVIAVFVLSITPKKYTAVTTLNFNLKGANPYADSRAFGDNEGSYIVTQVGIILSKSLARKVFDNLSEKQRKRLAQSIDAKKTIVDKTISDMQKSFREIFGISASKQVTPEDALFDSEMLNNEGSVLSQKNKKPVKYEWVVGALSNDLLVNPGLGSRIFTLSYKSTSPYIAKLIADTYALTYIETSLEMLVDPAKSTKKWFDDRSKSLKEDVALAQQSLIEFQKKQGIIATDERFDIESQRLLTFSAEYSGAQEVSRDAASLRSQVESRIQRGLPVANLSEIQNNAVIQKIKAEIRQIEGKLADLSAKLGVNHPQYKRVMSELSTVNSRLSSEINAIVSSLSTAELAALNRESLIKKALKQQKQLVLELKNHRAAIEGLQGELKQKRAAYDEALKQFNASNLQSLVTQTNVRVIDKAIRPKNPSEPKIKQNIILALIVGCMLGVGLAFLFELIDKRVRTKEDLIHDLNLPVLGVLEPA